MDKILNGGFGTALNFSVTLEPMPFEAKASSREICIWTSCCVKSESQRRQPRLRGITPKVVYARSGQPLSLDFNPVQDSANEKRHLAASALGDLQVQAKLNRVQAAQQRGFGILTSPLKERNQRG